LTEPEPEPKRAVIRRRQCPVHELDQVHPRFAMDWVRGVWTSQDRRTEEHTKASKSGMVVMN
jgi:hypothetical protein